VHCQLIYELTQVDESQVLLRPRLSWEAGLKRAGGCRDPAIAFLQMVSSHQLSFGCSSTWDWTQ